MIGKFLELSLPAPAILDSIAWWEALGFRQVDTNDTWRHPYAVVSDGRAIFGLHARQVEEPTLTFVRPALDEHIDRLRSLGVEFEFAHTGEEQFNMAAFLSPDNQRVLLLESRTCSPPSFEGHDISVLGRLDSLHIPARRIERTLPFWARLGLAVLEFDEDAPTSATITDGHLTIRLDEELRAPVLMFRNTNLDAVADALETRTGAPAEAADGALTMTSPEGLTIRIERDAD